MEELSIKEIRERLESGGAFTATTHTGTTLKMWHAGDGHYIVALNPEGGQPGSTSAFGLENIMSTMSQWAPLEAWTEEV